MAVGAVVRMLGQLVYLVLSSVTVGENLFAIMLSNVYDLLVRHRRMSMIDYSTSMT